MAKLHRVRYDLLDDLGHPMSKDLYFEEGEEEFLHRWIKKINDDHHRYRLTSVSTSKVEWNEYGKQV
jgi:hypothetical protein